MSGNDCPVGVNGKHQKGMSGCGCSQDPARARNSSSGSNRRGGKNRNRGGHRHDWSIIPPVSTRKTATEVITTITEKCLNDGCPGSPRTREQREPIKGRKRPEGVIIHGESRCVCCGAPFPEHRHRSTCDNCAFDDYQ